MYNNYWQLEITYKIPFSRENEDEFLDYLDDIAHIVYTKADEDPNWIVANCLVGSLEDELQINVSVLKERVSCVERAKLWVKEEIERIVEDAVIIKETHV